MTIVGDLYTVEERAKIQGMLTATWGIANLAGPLLGGIIATTIGWRWVFYVNIPFAIVSLALILFSYVDPKERTKLFAPIVSRAIMDDRVVRTGLIGSMLGGGAVNAALAYMPPWVEHEAHGTPLMGGATLIALMVGWSMGSTFGVHVLVARGMRASVGGGFAIATIGFAVVTAFVALRADPSVVLPSLFITGLGLGPALSTSMIGPQSRASWTERGMITSILFGALSLGGGVFVWALGAQSSPQRFIAITGVCVIAMVFGFRAPPRNLLGPKDVDPA
jgi:predicted MFS family arabinose efflux permease